jgi:phenylpyruvate tautomerase PptA (4-oxalocrotonate tautomerase family)
MPLIKIKSSVTNPDSTVIEDLLTSLSSKLAKHLGKSESYVMTVFESEVKMTFAGTFEPVCYIEIKSIGTMTPDKTKTMSQDFCQELEKKLGIPKNRIYIEFNDAKGTMWGWNGTTF